MRTLRIWGLGALMTLALGLLPPGLLAQEGQGTQETQGAQEEQEAQPPRTRPDPQALVFQREVFLYPQYQRRNPFIPLVGTGEGGPRFEELLLQGILFSPDPSQSVALFGNKTSLDSENGTDVPSSFRARRGQTIGNVKILEIQRTRVVVEVVEFGLTEQRIMELRRPGEGGSS
jgi:hypothetical protein